MSDEKTKPDEQNEQSDQIGQNVEPVIDAITWSTITAAGYRLPDNPDVTHYDPNWCVVVRGTDAQTRTIALFFDAAEAQRVVNIMNKTTALGIITLLKREATVDL